MVSKKKGGAGGNAGGNADNNNNVGNNNVGNNNVGNNEGALGRFGLAALTRPQIAPPSAVYPELVLIQLKKANYEWISLWRQPGGKPALYRCYAKKSRDPKFRWYPEPFTVDISNLVSSMQSRTGSIFLTSMALGPEETTVPPMPQPGSALYKERGLIRGLFEEIGRSVMAAVQRGDFGGAKKPVMVIGGAIENREMEGSDFKYLGLSGYLSGVLGKDTGHHTPYVLSMLNERHHDVCVVVRHFTVVLDLFDYVSSNIPPEVLDGHRLVQGSSASKTEEQIIGGADPRQGFVELLRYHEMTFAPGARPVHEDQANGGFNTPRVRGEGRNESPTDEHDQLSLESEAELPDPREGREEELSATFNS
jgi:hypothetical protein